MMADLSAWLARIVAVILLVSLVDLLLPNQTMQRYVRLVSGLLVLLTIATPVLSWFRSDFSAKLSANIDAVKLSFEKDDDAIAKIEDEGRKLSEARSEQAVRLAKAKLSAEIRTAVEEAGLGEVRDIEVGTEPDDSGVQRVTRVELTMAASSDGGSLGSAANGAASGGTAAASGSDGSTGAGDAGGEIADIEPVAPVDIRIDAEDGGDANADASGGSAASSDSPAAGSGEQEDAALEGRVAALLQGRFGVAPDQVVVRRESSASAY